MTGAAQAQTTKTLSDLTPLDARRVELAVADRAGFYAAAPFIGCNVDDVTRYIADGGLGEQLPHIKRADLWQIVQTYLREHPDLMDRDDEERERVLRERAARGSELAELARLAVAAANYPAAAQLLEQLEAHDPDCVLGTGVPIATMRLALASRLAAGEGA